ncbi:hypothetical protein [Streptomyces sp. NPDC058964]|uniref:hypothetical protein n=1 Tax=Streptomyces sp. NPDC058964 TaxID=3346681 RepID=UPI0036B71777
MFSKKETHFVVLNDLDEARAALQEALRQAGDDGSAPGLRRALEIADGIGGGEDPRVRWARQVLDGEGIDPRAREVHAVKALRQALPGLSLVAAVHLVRQCQAPAV